MPSGLLALLILIMIFGATNGHEENRSNNANLDEDNVLDPDID